MPPREDSKIPPLREPTGGWQAPFVERVTDADRLAVLSDFDGTIAEIQADPDAATMRPDARRALARLAGRSDTDVGVISGRSLADVRSRVGLDAIGYAGDHGFEIEIDDRRFTHPDLSETTEDLRRVCRTIGAELADIEGAFLEEKRATASVHYRKVSDEEVVGRIEEIVREVVGGDGETLRTTAGKQVIEIRPAIAWDKGRAVAWLLEAMGADPEHTLPLYIGDDVTDEAAFRAVTDPGTAIVVAEGPTETAADYRLSHPGEVVALLEWLGDARSV